MGKPVISVENLSKSYQLGQIGTGTLSRDLEVLWARMRGKPNPLLRIGEKDHGNRIGEEIWALKDVSFKVEQGEVLGIIGRNGAGKSTLLKILARVTAPTRGQVKVKGRIASLLEVGTGFHPELTGRENIYLNGAILGMTRQEIARKFDEIVDFSGVEKFIDTPVKRYSSGMYVRLAFAVAAYLESEILLVDEVLAVGDAEFQKKCLGKMGDVARNDGRTVFFVSHNIASIKNLCSRSILTHQGQVIEDGLSGSVIDYYLEKIINTTNNNTPLSIRTDRTGSGDIILVGFHIENINGKTIYSIKSGEDFILAFKYENKKDILLKNVDIGFSIHSSTNNQMLSVLYSSYVGKLFNDIPSSGYFRCVINHFNFAPGRYKVGARVVVNNIEADWPKDWIGFFDVDLNDYYGTGIVGYKDDVPFLLTGRWQVDTK